MAYQRFSKIALLVDAKCLKKNVRSVVVIVVAVANVVVVFKKTLKKKHTKNREAVDELFQHVYMHQCVWTTVYSTFLVIQAPEHWSAINNPEFPQVASGSSWRSAAARWYVHPLSTFCYSVSFHYF